MAITGLPPYKTPLEQSLRCVCKTRYIVFIGGCAQFDETLCKLACEHAAMLQAVFVDAREMPFMKCVECGGLLDFTQVSSRVVM